jgi:hypothetical protein
VDVVGGARLGPQAIRPRGTGVMTHPAGSGAQM